MFKYKYIGKNPVEVPKVGIVRPDYIFFSDVVIVHPLFIRVEDVAEKPKEENLSGGKKKNKYRNKSH